MRNNVQLIGNLGGAPEVKEIPGHGKVARVSIATHDSYWNNEGKYVTETIWHNLVLWNRMAERAEKDFQKGAEVALEGKIVNHSYEGKDGVKRYVSEILVNNFMVLSVQAAPKTEEPAQDATPKTNRKKTTKN